MEKMWERYEQEAISCRMDLYGKGVKENTYVWAHLPFSSTLLPPSNSKKHFQTGLGGLSSSGVF